MFKLWCERGTSLFIFTYFLIVITFLIWHILVFVFKFNCGQVTVTSEDVCWSIRNVKFINESFYNMRCLVMFVTTVCLLCFLKTLSHLP